MPKEQLEVTPVAMVGLTKDNKFTISCSSTDKKLILTALAEGIKMIASSEPPRIVKPGDNGGVNRLRSFLRRKK